MCKHQLIKLVQTAQWPISTASPTDLHGDKQRQIGYAVHSIIIIFLQATKHIATNKRKQSCETKRSFNKMWWRSIFTWEMSVRFKQSIVMFIPGLKSCPEWSNYKSMSGDTLLLTGNNMCLKWVSGDHLWSDFKRKGFLILWLHTFTVKSSNACS